MKKIIFILLLSISFYGISQNLVVTPQSATNLLNNILLGSNITATGITSKGNANQIGSFTGGFSLSPGIPFLFDQGIILTSGSITDIPGMNTSGGTSTAAGGVSDADLKAILKDQSNNTTDAAVIEFDFIAQSDSIAFKYVFASEEYPEYNCCDFNDVFAFFLTGSNPLGGNYTKKNIALIPGTNTMVNVNSVNAGVFGSAGSASNCDAFDPNWRNYSNYYNDNPKNSNKIKIRADGYTSVFTAGAKLVCGQSYHLKIAISDVGYSDNGYDSYLFLEAKSLKSYSIALSSQINTSGTLTNSSILTEGCSSGEVTFTASPTPTSILNTNYTVTGASTNGIDFPNLNGKVVISANQSSNKIVITANDDGIEEITGETVIINSTNCVGSSSKTLTIVDQLKVTCSSSSNSITFNWNNNGATQYNYSYSISGGAAVTGNTASGVTTLTVPSLTSGQSVTITITPSFGALGDGCTGTSTCSITGCTTPANPSVTTPVSYCQNATASALSATALSGNTLKWYGTASTAGTASTSATIPATTNSGSTTYYVSQITSDGCESSRSPIVVDIKAKPTITVNSPTICSNQTAGLTASGATTYSWDVVGGATGVSSSANFTTPQLTSNTSYTVTGTTLGCTGTATAVVTVAANLSITVNSPTICANQTATLNASGATTYSWDIVGGATGVSTSASFTTPQLTSNTSYKVTGTTSGCTGTATAVVTVNANPTIIVNSPTICSNQTATLNASGATTYSWDLVGGATGISTAASFTTPQLNANTSYLVTGTTLGCKGTATAVVTNIANLTITVNSPSICTNQTASLTASGATTYSWDQVGGSTGISTSANFTTPQLTSNTSYKVTGTTSGCTGSATAVVTVLPNLTITVNSPTICSGQSANLTASGATTYSWDQVGGASAVSNSASFTTPILTTNTSYKVTGTSSGCTGTATSIVTVNPTPTITVNSPTICNGQSATLNASGATTYTWDQVGGNSGISTSSTFTTSNLITNTSYVVTGLIGSCSNSSTSTVTVTPLINIVVNSPAICSGNSATLSVSGANTYTWSDGSTQNPLIVSPTSTTTYSVIGSIGTCTGTGNSTVTVNETPTLVIGTTPSGCAPKKVDLTDPSLTVGSTIGSTFQYWLNASGTIPLSSPSSVGNGTYYISNTKNGCSTIPVAVPVVINPIPVAEFTPMPFLVSTISPESKMNNQSVGAVKYFWDFGDGAVSEEINPTHTFSDSDTASYIIKLIANSTLGCSDTVAKKVKVYEELIYFIPNTFTPDQDNFNNTFQPVFVSGYDPYTFAMTIFNRWGEIVFESHDSKIGWKGTYGKDNTDIVKEGVYTWKIEFSLKSDDRRKQITGLVNLIK